MSNKGKIIACSTVSPLSPQDYDVNGNKVILKDLDNKIKRSLGDYRNAISEKNIKTLDMGKDDLISQLTLSLYIESDKIDNINKDFYSNKKRPDYDEAPSNDVENETFDKFTGVYVELQEYYKEYKVLARVRELKQHHNGKFIGKSSENTILNTAVYNMEKPEGNMVQYIEHFMCKNLYRKVDDDGYI